MKVRIHLRAQAATLRQLFERAGWHVDSAQDDRLCVSHAKITDEADARRQLDAMGLLTSNRMHIEFWPSASGLAKSSRG